MWALLSGSLHDKASTSAQDWPAVASSNLSQIAGPIPGTARQNNLLSFFRQLSPSFSSVQMALSCTSFADPIFGSGHDQ